jgi:outer membrane protein assembly factor BamB
MQEMVMKRITLLVLVLSTAAALADNWPAWRGPTGQGYCAEKGLPLTWSETENVRWKVPLEYQGNSTPVVWGDKIFLTQANKGGTIRGLVCLARADGKQLWKKEIEYSEEEQNWNANWYGNASPVTDGERVVVSFGSAGMYCYDFAGKELWKRTDLGTWQHQFGNGSSPVLYRDTVILWCGPNQPKGRNFLLAVNKTTGKTVWEQDQPGGSWSTPVIVSVNGQDQMLLAVPNQTTEGPGKLKGFDPATGKELWSCDGLTEYNYASALYANSIAVAMSGYGKAALAVTLGGSGDITKDRLWHHPKNIQRVGSGLIYGDHVYIVEENGLPHCYELKTGKEVWNVEKRPTTLTWGSMVRVEDKLYVLTRDADTVVFAASPKYELLATNRLSRNEESNSSLAISDGDIFIRTFKNLWCIRGK